MPGTGLCLVATNGLLQLAGAYVPIDVCAAVVVFCLQHEVNICQHACAQCTKVIPETQATRCLMTHGKS